MFWVGGFGGDQAGDCGVINVNLECIMLAVSA